MVEFSQIQSAYKSLKKIGSDKKLIHYTTTEVLDKILSSATFWASNILYLNDAEEYKNGKNVIESCLKKIGQNLADNWTDNNSDIYTISFCKEEDLLSQWIIYAKESGISLELDSRFLEFNRIGDNFYFCVGAGSDGQEKLEFTSQKYFIGDVLSEMAYINDTNEQFEKEMNSVLTADGAECLEESDKINFYELKASYIKNPKFKAEYEVRASFLNCKSLDKDSSKVNQTKIKHFRMSNGVLRPYIEARICVWHKDDDNNIQPCLPLKAIVIGPSGTQQMVFNSVVHRTNFGECNIYNYLRYDRQKFVSNFVEYLASAALLLNKKIKIKPQNIIWEEGKSIEQLFKFADEQSKNIRDILRVLTYEWIQRNESHIVESGVESCYVAKYKSVIKNNKELENVKLNLYLTKEGILIKKSKIPYIF